MQTGQNLRSMNDTIRDSLTNSGKQRDQDFSIEASSGIKDSFGNTTGTRLRYSCLLDFDAPNCHIFSPSHQIMG
jgi:hypothetical protein